MPTPRETILAALHATALRGDVLPERVPNHGLLILRDGVPGLIVANWVETRY